MGKTKTVLVASFATPSYMPHLQKMKASLHKAVSSLDGGRRPKEAYDCLDHEFKGWAEATCHKADFILGLLKDGARKFDYLIYVDADSVWRQWPEWEMARWEGFKEWGRRQDWCIAAPLLDCEFHRLHYVVPCHDSEILTGTLVFRNCDEARDLVRRWKWRCNLRPSAGDQPALQAEAEKREMLPPKGSALGLWGKNGMMWLGLEWCWLPEGYTREKDGVHFTTAAKGNYHILHTLASRGVEGGGKAKATV